MQSRGASHSQKNEENELENAKTSSDDYTNLTQSKYWTAVLIYEILSFKGYSYTLCWNDVFLM